MHVDHERHAQPVPAENLVELLGLNRRAGKAVEDIARRIAVLGHVVGDHPDDDGIGRQTTRLDICLLYTSPSPRDCS